MIFYYDNQIKILTFTVFQVNLFFLRQLIHRSRPTAMHIVAISKRIDARSNSLYKIVVHNEIYCQLIIRIK